MELGLKDKTALVTGASYGLGFACAKELSREGAKVVICSRDADRIQAAADDITSETGNEVTAIAADLTSETDISNLLEKSNVALGHIDILVLSTGHPPTYPFTIATDEDWETGIKLILQPAIKLSRGLLEGMRERKYGRLIFIGSVFGIEPEQSSVVQSTLRTGLNSFSKCIGTEAAADGVTSNVICPGYFETPLVTNLAQKYADEAGVPLQQILDGWKNFAPSKKFGKPEDLGAFVSLLASPRGEFFNGTSIVIDGGAIKQY
jgi:3-oxoacyl-[acyl-carrier protein] reductase